MFKNRSVKLSFVKDHPADPETVISTIDPEQIEEIARRSVLDLTKLAVGAVGSLMILHTTLKIVEHKATSDD